MFVNLDFFQCVGRRSEAVAVDQKLVTIGESSWSGGIESVGQVGRRGTAGTLNYRLIFHNPFFKHFTGEVGAFHIIRGENSRGVFPTKT